MYNLGPRYYGCGGPDCFGPRSDPANDCPKCEYKLQRAQWEKDVLAEIAKGSPGPEADEDWPLSLLHDTMNTISGANQMFPKGHSRKWSVTTAYLVGILRSEESKIRSKEIYDRQEARAAQVEAMKPIMGQQNNRNDEED